jgi:energy-converting hydrogenase Eha subunit H
MVQEQQQAHRILQRAGPAGTRHLSEGAAASHIINIEQSFLRLTGDDESSIMTEGVQRERAWAFFLQYGTLWLFASLALLGGAIIAFMDLSPILTL